MAPNIQKTHNKFLTDRGVMLLSVLTLLDGAAQESALAAHKKLAEQPACINNVCVDVHAFCVM